MSATALPGGAVPEAPGQHSPSDPALLLVAHGTRDPGGAVVTERVAGLARAALGVRVAACYADVRRPTPAEGVAELGGRCVAVPMFLAAGYHVRTDVPAQLAAFPGVVLAETFGPDPLLVAAAAERLTAAGARPGDAVVLAVAGSSDPNAQADGARAAHRLGRLLGGPVTLATIAAGGPRVPDAVAALRRDGAERVAVASWLLAPGLFQTGLDDSGADVVARPIAEHAAVVELVTRRYRAALTGQRKVG
jgi:sirohydrochlorin ferrochelatase